MDQVKTTRQDVEVPATTEDGRELMLRVRVLTRTRREECLRLAAFRSPDNVGEMLALRRWVFVAGVTAVGGAAYEETAHPTLGKVLSLDLYDDMTDAAIAEVCRVAAPTYFDDAAAKSHAKNSVPPPPGSTAVSG